MELARLNLAKQPGNSEVEPHRPVAVIDGEPPRRTKSFLDTNNDYYGRELWPDMVVPFAFTEGAFSGEKRSDLYCSPSAMKDDLTFF